MAKYEARHVKDDLYIVYKRRLFGLLPTLNRLAIWDGCDFNSHNKSYRPDWHWENADGRSSSVLVKHRARRALLREFLRVKGRVPNDWRPTMPMARLLEAASK